MKTGGIITRIAWRNVWRNPRRSGVLIGAVAVGVFSFIGSTAFTDGFGQAMITSAIDLQGGHVQVARRGYHGNPTLEAYLLSDRDIAEAARRAGAGGVAGQVVAQGMANSTEQAAGVAINGVDPGTEGQVSAVPGRIVEGAYLSVSEDPSEVLIGRALAERLRVRLGDKIVLMANDLNNEVSGGAYRIVGLFATGSTPFDKSQVFLHIEEARRFLAMESGASTVTVRLADAGEADAFAARLREAVSAESGGLEVLTWEDRNPMLRMAKQAYDYSALLTAIILFTAVGFTLMNSFLMVIFERIRELGILLAGGVRPRLIRRMLFREAFFIALLGAVAGILLAGLLLGYWVVNGLDLSAFAEGLGSFGVASVIYPVLDPVHLGRGFIVILVMVMLAVQYPAWKASRFEAVEAINHD